MVAFVLLSKLYRQMYANTGIATDSARTAHSVAIARWLARLCCRLFLSAPMPDLEIPALPATRLAISPAAVTVRDADAGVTFPLRVVADHHA